MNKLALIVLDGWGMGEKLPNNAIHVARTPFFDTLWNTFPHTTLQASGKAVGLPHNQIGGSEVGHITIGAGRIMYHSLQRINYSFSHLESSEGILNNPQFKKLLKQAHTHTTHLIGLVSPGGVHSHHDHLFQILEIMKKHECKQPWIHVITDGRDTAIQSAQKYVLKLEQHVKSTSFGHIATISGRAYAMDRDQNWGKIEKTSSTILYETPPKQYPKSIHQIIEESYIAGVYDEFILPSIIDQNYRGIAPHDLVFFWNFRSDRMKQIASKLHQKKPSSPIYTMTRYDKNLPFHVLFEREIIRDTLGEIISKEEATQLRTSETEKYAHVTYFFNGGVEVVHTGEIRRVHKSNSVSHSEKPAMRARAIVNGTERIITEAHPSFILVNFPNADMVGHTGNFQAVVRAVETVDRQLKRLGKFLMSKGYTCVVTADHGNADIMFNLETHEPHTAHTMNPVPFIIYDPNHLSIHLKKHPELGLSSIAGTILQLMGLPSRSIHSDSLIEKF